MISRWVAVIAIGLLAVPASAGEAQILQARDDKPGYAVGVGAGRDLRQLESGVDLGVGVQLAAVKKRKTRAANRSAEENRKAGEAFLAENRTKEGVVALPSGLQYKVLKVGDGKIPTDGDTVECIVRATFIDGTVFGGSSKPSKFKVGGTIPGLSEALKLMPVGSKWRLFIPPGLAYGDKGAAPKVGPNETLIYEVELLAVK